MAADDAAPNLCFPLFSIVNVHDTNRQFVCLDSAGDLVVLKYALLSLLSYTHFPLFFHCYHCCVQKSLQLCSSNAKVNRGKRIARKTCPNCTCGLNGNSWYRSNINTPGRELWSSGVRVRSKWDITFTLLAWIPVHNTLSFQADHNIHAPGVVALLDTFRGCGHVIQNFT